MSSSHGEGVEISVDLPGLHLVISGSPRRVGEFVRFAHTFPAPRARSPTASAGSFELLSEAPDQSPPPSRVGFGLESRDQISAGFAPCPARLLALGNKLSGASLSGRDRACRAWTAGLWAKAVLDSRVHSPNRTPPLDLRSRFYSVARADGVSCPVIFRSSASYWRALGSLEGSSVSQCFPSESEARIYLQAAGFADEAIEVLP